MGRAGISTDHHLATEAGAAALRAGGTAVDAIISAAAVLSVVSPHSSGLGGDAFAIVTPAGSPVEVLEAVGRAPSGADPAGLRKEGLDRPPAVRDMRSVTVPGCVDGWFALHERFGRLPVAELLEPAAAWGRRGFPASPELLAVLGRIPDDAEVRPGFAPSGADGLVRPADLARTMQQLAEGGRDAFYAGDFAAALVARSPELFAPEDLAPVHSRWRAPLVVPALGHLIHLPPPPSQAYVTGAAASVAGALALPHDPSSPLWPHLLSEAVLVCAHDREQRLHDGTDGVAELADAELRRLAASVRDDRTWEGTLPPSAGCTTYLCAVDSEGMGVSYIQSIASVFGSQLVVGDTGVVLHNRGQGFSLEAGHPAELAPGRRPPHTLAPALVTDLDGDLTALLGTRGADAQPQIVLQLLVRLLVHRQSAGEASGSARWLLSRRGDPFGTWRGDGRPQTRVEAGAPPSWVDGLHERGHDVSVAPAGDPAFGSAHVITAGGDGVDAAADTRTSTSASRVL